MNDMGVEFEGVAKIHEDNQNVPAIFQHDVRSERTKHIDVCYHLAIYFDAKEAVYFHYILTSQMISEIFTKSLPYSSHKCHCNTHLLNYFNNA